MHPPPQGRKLATAPSSTPPRNSVVEPPARQRHPPGSHGEHSRPRQSPALRVTVTERLRRGPGTGMETCPVFHIRLLCTHHNIVWTSFFIFRPHPEVPQGDCSAPHSHTQICLLPGARKFQKPEVAANNDSPDPAENNSKNNTTLKRPADVIPAFTPPPASRGLVSPRSLAYGQPSSPSPPWPRVVPDEDGPLSL